MLQSCHLLLVNLQWFPGGFPPLGHVQHGPGGQQLAGYFLHQQAQNYLGQAPKFIQGGGQGVYNATLNNNFAMNRTMWADPIAFSILSVLSWSQHDLCPVPKSHDLSIPWSHIFEYTLWSRIKSRMIFSVMDKSGTVGTEGLRKTLLAITLAC